GEHNREPARNQGSRREGERGPRRPELRPSTTAAPLSHRTWDCLTVPEVAEGRVPQLAIAALYVATIERLRTDIESRLRCTAGPDGSGRGASGGVWASLTFRPPNAVRNEREDRRRVDTRARSGALEPRAGDVRRVRLLGAGGKSRHPRAAAGRDVQVPRDGERQALLCPVHACGSLTDDVRVRSRRSEQRRAYAILAQSIVTG